MEKRHSGQHGVSCFPCKIQSIGVLPSATPSRHKSRRVPPRTPNNSYEKGIPRDSRGVPYLLPGTLEPAGQKFVNQNRHVIEENRRKLAGQAST